MAVEDVDDPEVKDEELVDFEGSDYDTGSEEEFEIETEVFGTQVTEEPRELKSGGEAERPLSENTANIIESAGEIRTQGHVGRKEDSESPDLQTISDLVPSSHREAAESGEIEEEKDDKDEGAVLQPRSNTRLDALKPDPAVGIGEVRETKHRKPDLEDGELDDASMLEGFNIDTEGRAKGEIVGREKKRRKDRFAVERQTEGLEGNDEKESAESWCFSTKQQQNRYSDRMMERLAGFARAGGRGVNMRMMNFGQVNMVPNVMGPGRPLVPFGIRNLGRAFGPLGGIASQGRHNVHFQELLTQEHLLRARAMQLAQGSIAGALRAPMTGPLGGTALRPFLGFDFLGPGSHSLLQFQPQPSDLITQMNIMGPVDNFIRGQRPNLAAVGTVGSGKSGGQVNPPSGSVMGRQVGWPFVPGGDEMQSLGRGRAGRGPPLGPWSEVQAIGHGLGGQESEAGHTNSSNLPNAGATSQGLAAGIQNMSSGKVTKAGWLGMSASQADGTSGLNEFDARWKIERERMLRNGLLHAGLVDDGIVEENPSGIKKECGKDENSKKGKAKVSVLQDNLPPSSITTLASSESQDKSTAVASVSSSRSSAGSNVIHLLQPIRKSRMLTVSGLPDNISMSTIVEAFEKQGKITDLKKGPKGDVFTISYSTEIEAVTAKRSLHRSFLAGRQITVEYAYR